MLDGSKTATDARFFALALIADSKEVAEAVETYLQRDMRYWGYDGLILDPAFDRHRDHHQQRARWLTSKTRHRTPRAAASRSSSTTRFGATWTGSGRTS